jgi:DNA-directed RNA polymerase subunit RPC12/RpoP
MRPWGRAKDAPPPPAPAARPGGGAETHRFPCPACGADLRFEPGTTGMVCAHCGHREAIPELRGGIEELDLRAAAALPSDAMESIRVARCTSCGAEVEFDPDVHAKECPFCASPMVTDTGEHRQIKPQAQLPFLVTEAEARAAMRRWLGRLWFAPSDLVRRVRAERGMDGIYAPYWTYDAETVTDYAGQRGTVHYRTRQVRVVVKGRSQLRSEQVPEVHWTPARGRVSRRFDDVLVLGSKSLPKSFADAIAPFDLPALSAYEPRYLAGFRAEGYTVGVEDAYREARSIMNAIIEHDVRADIGGDQQRITRMDTDVGALTFKHVLLPLWLAAYRYRGKSYRFVVNGRTGAVQGERPYSAVKIALAVLAMAVLALAIAWFQIAQS